MSIGSGAADLRSIIPWPVFDGYPIIPHKPHPKQLAFLLLNDYYEVGFGGSAGPGKSEALLMAAAQYVDVPHYAAIIFRKTLSDLQQPNALLSRAMSWFSGWPWVKYEPAKHSFTFYPSGATITFGYIGEFRSEDRYQGAEYSFVGFDEATQHFQEDYAYLHSRLRQPKCEHHGGRKIDGEPAPLPDDPKCSLCREYAPLRRVPLRMRSATNPGSIGHKWYKKLFGITFDQTTGHWVGTDPERPFVPARFTDNPSIDHKEYAKSLSNLDPLTRSMLLDGDWAASQDARFKRQWFGNYELKGDMIIITDPKTGLKRTLHRHYLQIFITIDPAASAKEGIAGVRFQKMGEKSHSVISTWGVTPTGDLLWLDMDRMQTEAPEFLQRVRTAVRIWKPSFVVCEAIGVGLPIYQMLSSMGMPIEPLRSVPDKVANAIEAQVRAEQGKVFLPTHAIWLTQVDDEVFIWTGHPHEAADIVDTLSNAAHQVTRLAGEDQFDHLSSAGAICEAHVPQFDIPIGGNY